MSREKQANLPTAIDLFCGAGGLSEGFRQAGFRVLVGNDADKFAGVTYTVTHCGAVFLPGPIQSLSAADFLRAAKLRKGELDALLAVRPVRLLVSITTSVAFMMTAAACSVNISASWKGCCRSGSSWKM